MGSWHVKELLLKNPNSPVKLSVLDRLLSSHPGGRVEVTADLWSGCLRPQLIVCACHVQLPRVQIINPPDCGSVTVFIPVLR